MTQVAVIGPGALGCLFSLRFMRCGARVLLVDHRHDRRELLRQRGIILETDEGTCTARPEVVAECPPGMDLALVVTKAHATETVTLPPKTPVLTLQNGIGNAEILARKWGDDFVLAGTTSEGVTLLDTGHARHAAHGKTVFGPWGACPVDVALDLFQRAGFDTALTPNPAEALWRKVALNAAINPLTALLQARNGRLAEVPESRALMRALAAEALAAARSAGYCLEFDAEEEAVRLCAATRDNESSMLQDIRRKRRTEIEAISGALLRLAHEKNLHLPCTELVYRLICAMESL